MYNMPTKIRLIASFQTLNERWKLREWQLGQNCSEFHILVSSDKIINYASLNMYRDVEEQNEIWANTRLNFFLLIQILFDYPF